MKFINRAGGCYHKVIIPVISQHRPRIEALRFASEDRDQDDLVVKAE